MSILRWYSHVKEINATIPVKCVIPHVCMVVHGLYYRNSLIIPCSFSSSFFTLLQVWNGLYKTKLLSSLCRIDFLFLFSFRWIGDTGNTVSRWGVLCLPLKQWLGPERRVSIRVWHWRLCPGISGVWGMGLWVRFRWLRRQWGRKMQLHQGRQEVKHQGLSFWTRPLDSRGHYSKWAWWRATHGGLREAFQSDRSWIQLQ